MPDADEAFSAKDTTTALSVQNQGILQKIVAWVTDHWSGLLSLLGSIIFCVIGVLPRLQQGNSDHVFIGLLVTGIIAVLAGGVGQILLSPRVSLLKDELEVALENVRKATEDLSQANADHQQKYHQIFNNELFVLFRVLDFGENERVNLLIHDGEDKMYLIGRYAMKTRFQKKGRSYYKDNEGVIGFAWRDGKCFVDDLPEDDFDYAKRCVRAYGMVQDDAFALRMKSRTIGAFAIRDSLEQQQVAVLVFESIEPNAFLEEDLSRLVENGEERRISLLIDQLRDVLPDPNIASEEGF